ncbi:cyclic nucleotide-binding protein [Flavobacterium saliperosum S13]|uniref:cAMP-binding domain of CRP or a regulatory subunit of cAMP-dependent protein kinases n=2 Tax=Flavobacterium saliperosum TaxID=329186 RepID=A0A1G4V6D1_9FLAO|nr:Crp/Fnr family transcriptional regulator [Flavobacterium saliperosum]ESU27920.1 cyclic nucleotide-binding protein [Flavobacterium saliperosum S13]SCX01940.1 cAMP-binding domain of CRP or a regulatory subunit of cAMP-dependent protein kinases [Flavobacterium saliperosum]
MNLLLENIAKHVSLTTEEQERVLTFTETRHYKAKTLLLKEGEICTHSYFVTKGILRSYNIDENGVEHVVSFACPGWWIADMYSFLSQRPGQLYIEVNEEAEVILLSKENRDILFTEVPKMERFFRILIENSLVANQQRLIDNLSFTAEARYDKFTKKYAELVHCLPQKQIASYIGVTPEFFSKMKARLLKK